MQDKPEVKGPTAVDMMVRNLLRTPGLPGDGQDALDQALKFQAKMAAVDVINKTAAQARRDAKEAEGGGGDSRGSGGGSGFQVKGGLDFGTFNLQEMLKQSQDREIALTNQFNEQLRATGVQNAELQKQINELQMDRLKLTLGGQIAALNETIAKQGSPKTFMDQLQEAQETAKILGFQMSGGQAAGITSPEIELKLKELEFNNAKALKEMDIAAAREKREWDLKLMNYDEDKRRWEAEMEMKRQQGDQWANMFSTLGQGAARGFMNYQGGDGGNSGIAGAPSKKQGASARPTKGTLEAPMGVGGDAECPSCGTLIGIGPTARTAVCSKCGLKVSINRIPAEAPAPGPDETEAPPPGPPAPPVTAGEPEEE